MFISKKTVKLLFALLITTISAATMALAYDVKIGTVNVDSNLNVREKASSKSSITGSLKKDSEVVIVGAEEDWYSIIADRKAGYVYSEYVSIAEDKDIDIGYGMITGSVVNVRKDTGTESEILTRLKKATSVKLCGVKNGWFKVETGELTGYVDSEYIKFVESFDMDSSTELRSQIVSYAKKFLGVKYVYGGTTTNGFDCSGFTQYVFNEFDIDLPRTSLSQSKSCVRISKDQLMPGDLVFFSGINSSSSSVGHVGIYIGNGSFIHAPSTGDVVKISKLSSSYYQKHYVCAGRVL